MSGRQAPAGTRDIPLQAGASLPSLAAQGWISGPPPTADDLAGRPVVLDLWDDMSAFCRKTAPDLVQVYRKYSPRGVVFVGLSVADQQQAETFIRATGMSWTNGFGAEETIKQLGAPPLLFVIDRSGRVVWNDRRSRSWQNDVQALDDLQAILDDLLDEQPTSSRAASD